MSNGLNANIKLRRALASEWEAVNPILLPGEPGVETDTFKLKIGNGILNWKDLPYIGGCAETSLIYNAILIVDELPEVGSEQSLYKVSSSQKLYYWDSIKSEFICLNFEFNADDFVDTNTNNMVVIDELPETGEDLYLYKLSSTQELYYWNSINGKFVCLNVEIPEYDFVDTNTNNVLVVEDLPETGEDIYFYKVNSTQKMYYWDSVNGAFICLNVEIPEIPEIPEFVDTNTDNIVLVETLPKEGVENLLYKLPDQTFHFWNTLAGAFAPLMPKVIIPENPVQPEQPVIPEAKGGIEVVDAVEDLPETGASDMLYKVRADELVYTWNESTGEYKAINSATEFKNNIVVVEGFSNLPEEGANDILYKINSSQLLYMWNNITKVYEQLGQGTTGPGADDGYVITLQNTLDSRIFAVREGDPVNISFRYASVDVDGLNDGPGIGTLIVNDVKKATIAIPQKLNTLEIGKHLALGENNVQLIVENSESETKPLNYQIEVVNLQLTTNFKDMDIYSSEVDFAFVIVGSGTKTVHYLMDGEEIDSEVLTNTNKLAHNYKIPMQTAGDHIFQVYADMEVSNMYIPSNTLTLGMMFVNDQMVNTHILSNFTQKESAQGDVVNIPYLVYNPLNETSEVDLKIYDAEGEVYFKKTIFVDQSVHNWIQQDYPAGEIVFEITAKSDSGENAVKRFPMTIEESSFDLVPVATNLALEFDARGRSNDEANPEHWSYGDIEATFERFAWSVADGWVESDSGETVLRFLPKNKMVIPYQPFATDKRSTGYTIEVEMATHNVKDYDSVVISCVHDGRGFVVKSQSLIFKSEQSEEIITMFKEDERVRITITIEPQTLNRFVKLYVNGILCGVDQYKENDNFKQAEPQNITIGSDTCGLDLYKLRFYNRNLSDAEQLNNFICDRSTIAERIEAKERNEIYDISGNLTIGSLPPSIPYIVLQCEELPQYKGDKKKDKSMYFVDRLRPDRSFSATGCQFDVQGTSSAGYPIKNFKVKFGDGIVYNDGTTDDGFPILEGGLISECLCLKADFASSEQANNVMLVDYYDELVRDYFLTPAQEEDPRVRTGIAGRPIVVFWENTTTGEIKFQGQYNMNNDKSNENVFGFDRDKWPRTECWEFSNNTSDRTLMKKSEWLEEVYDEKEAKMVPAWTKDFEARFPDLDDPYQDYTQFKRFCDFMVSTDRRQATNAALMVPVTYGDVTYEYDNEDYRLAKFTNEFKDYAVVDAFIFYYIFTETFHLMDSRAKNMFLTTFDGEHWFPIPYDMDTAIGINNEGDLVFEYDIEDTDKVNNENVFTGQDNTIWHNVRDAFQARRYEMYDELRQSDKFSFDIISKKMNDHQKVWPEAIWNADAKVKYLDIYLTEGEEYFEMCQGDKSAQRLWWLFNAFKYRDSKYRCGDSEEFSAFFRAYAPGDMTVTPYQHLWPRVDYTDSYPVSQRSKRNVENVLECPLDTASDTEIFLRSADRMSSFGDLSQYKADTVKFASAVKLQELILGSSEEGYENHKLTAVELGNNRLISYLNVENCINLVNPIDLSNCYNLETVKARGSALNSITFPVGGHLTTLELPGSFTNFTIRNQHNIENFSMASYDLINTIWVDDTPGLPIEEMLLNTPKLDRVRIVNTTWHVSSEQNLKTIFEKLKKCGGLDANGNNTVGGNSVMTGYVEIDAISDEFLEELNEFFKELVVIVNGKARFFIRYLNRDNTLLYKYAASIGDDAIDPIALGLINTPFLEGTEDTRYEFSHWSNLPTNIQGPQNLIAMYDIYYRVQFFDGDGNVRNTQWVHEGDAAVDPVEQGLTTIPTKTSDVQYNYVYSNWAEDFSVINAPLGVHAEFTNFLRDYPVYFYNGPECIQETREYYGTFAQYHGDETLIKKKIGGEESPYYEFAYWSPSISEPIVGATRFDAQFVFDGFIKDSWTEIAQNVASGNLDNYGYGGKKTTEISYYHPQSGQHYTDTIDFEIIDKNHDKLAQVLTGYNSGSEYAGLTFRGKISPRLVMNYNGKEWNGVMGLDGGGWAKSDMRAWLNSADFFGSLPEELRRAIKTVEKYSDNGYNDYHPGPATLTRTEDKIYIAALEELNAFNRNYTMAGQGEPFIMFTDANSRKIGDTYWTRSTGGNRSYHTFCIIDFDGFLTTTGGANPAGIVIYFSI